MNLNGPGYPEDAVLRALASYLEVLESGGDGEAFLRRHAEIENELRALAGVDASLRVEVPEEMFAGRRGSLAKFHAAIADDDSTARALAWFKPRLFGIIGAIGLGAGLTGAFASGALPMDPVTGFIESLPVVGHVIEHETPQSELVPPPGVTNPGLQERQGVPVTERQETTDTARPVNDPATPIVDTARDAQDGSGEPQEPRVPGAPVTTDGPSADSPSVTHTGLPTAGAQSGSTPPAASGAAVEPGSLEEGLPPGQGGENPGNGGGQGNGVGQGGTPPGQDGENPGNGGGQGNGVGQGGTPPGQGGGNPGNGGTPPGQQDDGAPGNSDGTPGGGNSNNDNGPPEDPGPPADPGPPEEPGSQGNGGNSDGEPGGGNDNNDPGPPEGAGPPEDPGNQGNNGNNNAGGTGNGNGPKN